MQRQRPVHRILLLMIALLLVPILSCEWFGSKGPTIARVVLAKSVEPDSLDPIDITDVYTEDQPDFHAVIGLADAPTGTVIKAVWIALNVGDAAPPNTVINQSEQKVQGAHNLHFAVSPDFGRWPPGLYRFDLYVNGALNQTLNFQVAPSPTAESKSMLGVCPSLPPPALETSDVVESVTLATDVRGEDKEPVGETTVFPPSAVFHAVVLVVDAPENTTMTATWYATDLGELSSCNTRLLKTDVVVSDTRNVDFSLTSQIPWPDGEYRVEISENGALIQVAPFKVSSTAPSETPSARQP